MTETVFEKRVTQSAEIDKVIPAICRAWSKFPSIPRNGQGGQRGGRSWTYSTLDDVYDAIRPHLAAEGLMVMHRHAQLEGDDRDWFLTQIWHGESQQWIGHWQHLDKWATDHALGSQMTYRERYGTCALLSIVPADDDDAQDAVAVRTERRPQAKPPEQTTRAAAKPPEQPPEDPPAAHRPPPADSARNPADRTKPVDRDLLEKRIARIESAEEIVDFCTHLPEYPAVAENPATWPTVATLLVDRLRHGRSAEAWPPEACDEASSVLGSVWLAVAAGAVASLERGEQLLAWCIELRTKAAPKNPEQWREIARLVLARTVKQVEAEAWPQKLGDELGNEMRLHTAVYKPLLEAKENDTPTNEKESNGDENEETTAGE